MGSKFSKSPKVQPKLSTDTCYCAILLFAGSPGVFRQHIPYSSRSLGFRFDLLHTRFFLPGLVSVGVWDGSLRVTSHPRSVHYSQSCVCLSACREELSLRALLSPWWDIETDDREEGSLKKISSSPRVGPKYGQVKILNCGTWITKNTIKVWDDFLESKNQF